MPPKATVNTGETPFGLRATENRLLLQGLVYVGPDGKPDFEKIAAENGMLKTSACTMYGKARRRLEANMTDENKKADAPEEAEGDQPQTPASATKKRGRKPKTKPDAENGPADESEASPTKPPAKRRGRKPKAAVAEEPVEAQGDTAPEPIANDQDQDAPVNDPTDQDVV